MKKRNVLALLAALMMLAAVITGCSSGTAPASAESAAPAASSASTEAASAASTEAGGFPETGTFVYIGRGMADPFCALNAAVMQKMFLEAHPGWTFSIQDANNDAAKLIQIIEDATAQGVDIIGNGGVAGADCEAAARDAIDSGIFMFGIETPVAEKDGIAPYVYVDFYNTYKVLMDWSVDQVPEGANAVVLSGIQGFEPCTERERALEEFLAARPDVNVLAYQYANYNTDEAMDIMEDWLQMYDNIDAVISLTDTMAIGAIEAYRAAGVDCTDVWICGVDALKDACGYIKSDELTVSVFRAPAAYAQAEIDLCERYYAGELTDPTEAVLLNCEVIVTKENVDDILAQQE